MKSGVAWLCAWIVLTGTGCGRSGGASALSSGRVTPEPGNPAVSSAASVSDSEGRRILPIPALGYNAREGRALYLHYCATCHGAEGHGDGFNAYNLDPKPRDLAEPAFQARISDDDLATVIRSGGGASGLSTGMPPWGRTLNERKIRNLVAYLRTLTPPPE